MKKQRADILLYEKGLVNSREKARRIIMEGVVYIGNRRIDKPGEKVDADSTITIRENPIAYVSRGGLKLEKAINIFNIDLKDKIAIDIGASTGGFTDCMLKNGVKKVYAIDVGYGQLDWKIRNDPRVVVMERTNIRNVTEDDIGEIVDFISIDVSFISLKLVLPVAKKLVHKKGCIMALIKPQFEAGREKVGKKGLVKDKKVHLEVIKGIAEFCKENGMKLVNLAYSPITGATGNIEYLSLISFGDNDTMVDEDTIIEIIDNAQDSLYP